LVGALELGARRDGYRALARAHAEQEDEARGLAAPIPAVPAAGAPGATAPAGRAWEGFYRAREAYHAALRRKYERAARFPFLPGPPRPPGAPGTPPGTPHQPRHPPAPCPAGGVRGIVPSARRMIRPRGRRIRHPLVRLLYRSGGIGDRDAGGEIPLARDRP